MTHEYLKDNTVQEKVLLIIIEFKGKRALWSPKEDCEEMKELVNACGGEVVESFFIRVNQPTASFLISEGRVKEIAEKCAFHDVDTVIFNHDLKGSQQRNLEGEVKVKTIDRTQLILDIFAKHATSKEGKMQVELAQLEYLLPRLVGRGIELSRLGGGIGTLGPGETKLEVDRRRIGQRIAKLKKNLDDVSQNRKLKRKQRKEKGIPMVSLVGYTNAGKSTLLNALTESEQKTRDGLFTTLDSLSRRLILPNNQKVILSDTVGFMHDLPHRLIEAFKATLEEVNESDLLLHVLDISHPNFRNLHKAVLEVLRELEVKDTPIITVLNKSDKIEDPQVLKKIESTFHHSVLISAKKRQGLEALQEAISNGVSSLYIEVNADIPPDRMDLIHLAHERGEVFSVKYYNDRIHLRASLPAQLARKFENKKISPQ